MIVASQPGKRRVSFFGTGTSARSRMAEGLLLRLGGPSVKVHSAEMMPARGEKGISHAP